MVVCDGETGTELPGDGSRLDALVHGLVPQGGAASAPHGNRGGLGKPGDGAHGDQVGLNVAVAVVQNAKGAAAVKGCTHRVGNPGVVEGEVTKAVLGDAGEAGRVGERPGQDSGQEGVIDIDIQGVGSGGDRTVQAQRDVGSDVDVVEVRDATENHRIEQGAVGIIDQQTGAGGHGERPRTDRASHHRGARASTNPDPVTAEDKAAGTNGNSSGERAGTGGKLEETVAGLGDGGAGTAHQGGDVQRGLEIGIGLGADGYGGNGHRVGSGSERQSASGDRGGGCCVGAGGRHRIVA